MQVFLPSTGTATEAASPSTPALHNFLTAHAATWLGWQNPSPAAYVFTLPPSGNWLSNLTGQPEQSAELMLANTLFSMLTNVMHLAIQGISNLATPEWLIEPMIHLAGTVVKHGGIPLLQAALPLLLIVIGVVMMLAFVRGRLSESLRHPAVFLASVAGALVLMLYFSPVLQLVNRLAIEGTNTVSASLVQAVDPHAGSLYDLTWQDDVLEPWEAIQFGASAPLQDFTVSSYYAPQKTYGSGVFAITVKPGENWVTLFLQNPTPDVRQNLIQALYAPLSQHRTPFTGFPVSRLEKADPAAMQGGIFVMTLCILPSIAFFLVMAFYLFYQTLFFLFYALLAVIIVPMGTLPQWGWPAILRWARQMLGALWLRLLNLLYVALVDVVLSTILGLMNGNGIVRLETLIANTLVSAVVFGAALFFRPKVIALVATEPALPWQRQRSEEKKAIETRNKEARETANAKGNQEGKTNETSASANRTEAKPDTDGKVRGVAGRTGQVVQRHQRQTTAGLSKGSTGAGVHPPARSSRFRSAPISDEEASRPSSLSSRFAKGTKASPAPASASSASLKEPAWRPQTVSRGGEAWRRKSDVSVKSSASLKEPAWRPQTVSRGGEKWKRQPEPSSAKSPKVASTSAPTPISPKRALRGQKAVHVAMKPLQPAKISPSWMRTAQGVELRKDEIRPQRPLRVTMPKTGGSSSQAAKGTAVRQNPKTPAPTPAVAKRAEPELPVKQVQAGDFAWTIRGSYAHGKRITPFDPFASVSKNPKSVTKSGKAVKTVRMPNSPK
ncbi:hypothetical protein ACOJUR_08605 [Alicyclobacillus tolerans]|uniref:hypothetical protein n=1 Tax=Alicyclobacillus tolerans TaxID=90970 RepID=UPI003B77C71D